MFVCSFTHTELALWMIICIAAGAVVIVVFFVICIGIRCSHRCFNTTNGRPATATQNNIPSFVKQREDGTRLGGGTVTLSPASVNVSYDDDYYEYGAKKNKHQGKSTKGEFIDFLLTVPTLYLAINIKYIFRWSD